MKKLLFALMLLIPLMPIGSAYAWGGNDNSDRLSSDQAGVFSPGYLNAAKQQAYNIVNQNNKPKSWWEKLVDNVKNKTSNNIDDSANTKVNPEIKKKTSAKGSSKITTTVYEDTTTSSTSTGMVDSTDYDVAIGSGTDQWASNSGNGILSEVINGTRHYYAGFDGGYATIQEAVDAAFASNGGIIIVKAKDEGYSENISVYGSNIRVLGGYASDGTRDIIVNETIMNGDVTVGASDSEINGFTFNTTLIVNFTNNVTIANNKFLTYNYYGAIGEMIYTSVFKNNTFSNSSYGIYLSTGTENTLSGNTFNSYGVAIANGETSVYSDHNNYIGDYSFAGGGAFYSTSDWGNVWHIQHWGGGMYDYSVENEASNINTGVSDNQLTGTITTYETVTNERTITSTSQSQLSSSSSNYWRNISSSNIFGVYTSPNSQALTNLSNNTISQDSLSSMFKGLLANKNVLRANMGTPLNEAVVGRLVTDSLASAVGVPSLMATEGRIPEMQIAMALANILRNPNENQKAILDAVESLLADMKNLQEKAGANPELNKAESDLLQMVAAVLLAQGVPDLLKAGDIEGVKGIFKDLGQSKDKIMMDYTNSIKPYYSNIVKELTSNVELLQLNGMLSNKITEEELKKLEPREIDKILEAIRKANDKTFELEYILQQDAKYRKEYLDPQNKTLEKAMKIMLNGFTQRISKALEDKK